MVGFFVANALSWEVLNGVGVDEIQSRLEMFNPDLQNSPKKRIGLGGWLA